MTIHEYSNMQAILLKQESRLTIQKEKTPGKLIAYKHEQR